MHFTPATLPNGKPVNERLTLFVLAAVQFTHVLDFVIVQPLGPRLMDVFQITAGDYTRLVATYGIAAAVTGFFAGFIMDRVNRKRALLALYAGFGVSTLGCALAPTYWALMAARFAAGAFGGVAGSVVAAMVGDIIPPERRGRAMSIVASAFPVASILGIPLGLRLAGAFEWHAPFFALTGLSVIVFCVGLKTLPSIKPFAHAANPWRQAREIFAHPVHKRGFAVSMVLVFAGASVIPLMAATMRFNAGISEDQLFLVYLCGGALTFMATPLVGWLTDFCDKVKLVGAFCLVAACAVLVLTNLGASRLVPALMVSSFFMASMAARFGPTSALLLNAVDARYRGGFMSVNAAVQQASAGIATICGGLLVTSEPVTQRLVGLPWVGVMSAAAMLSTYLLARRVRDMAPWAAKPGARTPVVQDAGTLVNRLAATLMDEKDAGKPGAEKPGAK